MTKTLIVHYTPRGERSSTLKLLKGFQSHAKGEVEVLDLCEDTPAFLSPANLPAYFKRDYMGEKLSAPEAETLAGFDRHISMMKKADVVVLAYPMYNFSMPAMVKAWFDGILLKGHTWNMNEKGYVGLLPGKKAVIISTSGAEYSGSPMSSMEHSLSLAKALFGFMGFTPVEVVSAEGINSKPHKKDETLDAAAARLAQIAKDWNC
ncbi:FMN-dependent NADH-azoreductase [uncultured archaeon]|nr:FMN-dependent NADH-azoreductase [uncultured archaeon]